MIRSFVSKFALTSALTLVLVAVAYAVISYLPRPLRPTLKPLAELPINSVKGPHWIRAVPISELETGGSFTAKVEYKEAGEHVSSKPYNTNRVQFLSIHLRLGRHQELAIYEENPDENARAFYDYLRIGERYEFPRVFHEWKQDRRK